jgi:hypothetical protein
VKNPQISQISQNGSSLKILLTLFNVVELERFSRLAFSGAWPVNLNNPNKYEILRITGTKR